MMIRVPSFMMSMFATLFLLNPNVMASLEDEFGHYSRSGRLSSQFYANIMADLSEREKALVPRESKDHCFLDSKKKLLIWQQWQALSSADGLDLKRSILYLQKTLDINWHCETAIKLTQSSVAFANICPSPQTAMSVLHNAFVALGVHLKEPKYDLHLKTGVLPSINSILVKLSELTAEYKTVEALKFPVAVMPNIFEAKCIPQAQIFELLMVAYGALFFDHWNGEEDQKQGIDLSIFNAGNRALDLYVNGLSGSTTPDQRQYYHERVVGIVRSLQARVPHLMSQGDRDYEEMKRGSALAVARIYKDSLKGIDRTNQTGILSPRWIKEKLRVARAYFLAGKGQKELEALKELQTDVEAIKWFSGLNRLKYDLGYLITEISAPESLLTYERKNQHLVSAF